MYCICMWYRHEKRENLHMIIFHIEMVKDFYSREHNHTWEHMLMHSTLSTCYDESKINNLSNIIFIEYFLAGNTTHSNVGKGKNCTGKWIPIILVPVIGIAVVCYSPQNRSTIGTIISQCKSLYTCSVIIT